MPSLVNARLNMMMIETEKLQQGTTISWYFVTSLTSKPKSSKPPMHNKIIYLIYLFPPIHNTINININTVYHAETEITEYKK